MMKIESLTKRGGLLNREENTFPEWIRSVHVSLDVNLVHLLPTGDPPRKKRGNHVVVLNCSFVFYFINVFFFLFYPPN